MTEEPPEALVHEDSPAEAALCDLLVAANAIDQSMVADWYPGGRSLITRLHEAAKAAAAHYPGEGKLIDIPVQIEGMSLAHNYAFGPPPDAKQFIVGDWIYSTWLTFGSTGPCYLVDGRSAERWG